MRDVKKYAVRTNHLIPMKEGERLKHVDIDVALDYAEADNCRVMVLASDYAALRARVAELEQALRLHLAVSHDDPILVEPVEQEVVRLKARCEALKQALKGLQAIARDYDGSP